MDKKKQIEEITKILDSNCEGIPDTVCQENSCSSCKAKQIIGVGYRKQSVGEWLPYPDDSFMKCSVCGMEYPKARMPHTVGYCPNPNCGAKMKGV